MFDVILPNHRRVFGLLILVLGMAGGTADAFRPAPDRECLIVSTASNRGEVDPCG